MKQWRFVANQNSTIYGINDAGIETFTANMDRSLVREIIQNSLDATLPGYSGPTRVEFSLFQLPTQDMPDVEHFKTVIQMCRDSNSDEPDACNFFNRAASILSKDTIDVLRISDYNTIGLEGSDTSQKGTTWSRLVKENGSSNKGQNSGGSFGIGKSAAFACSDLRTVFYSSLNKQGQNSNFGVARLVSFQDPNLGWTTGVGYYSEDERFVAINELATFDSSYTRKASGTDIYIFGMHQSGDIKVPFIKAILLDFMVSIIKGKLEVVVQDQCINKNTLIQYMSKLNPHESDDIKALLNYYHILTSPDPEIIKIALDNNVYGKDYGFSSGECTLYLKEGESYNRKILITRSAGMRIFEQDRISGSIEFSGVLLIDGANMNATFKAMEVPSHDAWEPGRCRENRKFYEGAFRDLKRYLKSQVIESFTKESKATIDAFGASDFLPDRIDDEGQNAIQKVDLSTRIKELLGKRTAPTKKKVRQLDLISKAPREEQGEEKKKSDKKMTPPSLPKGSDEGERVGYKEISVKKRLTCTNASQGSYVLSFISPSSAKHGKIAFTLSGEQSDFDLPIQTAQIQQGQKDTKITRVVGSVIYLEGLKKGDPIKIEVGVDFDNYCMMEVDYFASKK